MPTVPFQPASSHVCLGTTWVAVDCGGSTSAGAMRRTITVWPSTSPIMHPMNSVGNERYWRVRKRRAWAERLSVRSEEHTSELQSRLHLVCRLLLEKKKKKQQVLHSLTSCQVQDE